MATNQSVEPELPIQTPPPELEDRDWKAVISGRHPAFNWAVAAVLGMVSISRTSQDTAVRLILPVAVLFAYTWIAYPRDNKVPGLQAARIAQLADSAYFLGFLWTLWALIDSFVLRHATGAETAFRVFGYALATTAAGMGIRLFLLQFKYGAGEQESEANLRIEQSLEKFSSAMQDASRTAQMFQKLADALNASILDLSKSLETLDENFESTHRDTVKTIGANIKDVVEEIRSALKTPVQEYGRAVRAFTANVDQQSRILSQSMHDWSTEIHNSIKASVANTHKLLKETGETLATDHLAIAMQLQDDAKRISEQLQVLSKTLAMVNLPTNELQSLIKRFVELQESLSALGAFLGPEGKVTIDLTDFSRSVNAESGAVAGALKDLCDKLNSISVPTQVSVDVTEMARSIEKLRQATEDLTEKISDPRWEKSPQVASDALVKLTGSVNKLRDSLDEAGVSTARKRRIWPF